MPILNNQYSIFNSLRLVAILALAAAFRFYGLRWGLPNELHSYSYHPDEFLTIGASFWAVYLHRSFDPRFYNYPSLYIYLSALAMAVGFGYGVIPNEQGVYLAARVVTALMGVGAVAATYWAGLKLFNNRTAALLAALFLCIAPLHVQHSHFATVDVPSTLFVALCLGYAGLVLNRGTWRDYVMAGAMAGLAAGTKYNAGLVVFAPIAAHFLRGKVNLKSIASGRLWAIVGCMVLAFVISTPGSVFRTQEFLHGLTYEMRHASTGHGLVFAGTGNGFVYTVMNSLWYGLGFGLLILGGLGAIYGLLLRRRTALVLLAFVVPYFVMISLSEVRFARYTLPLFPALMLLGAGMLGELFGLVRRPQLMLPRAFLSAVCVLSVIATGLYSVELNRGFSDDSAWDSTARWIGSHIPKGSSIGILDYPWFYSPPLSNKVSMDTLPQRQEAVRSLPYRMVVFSEYDEPGDWWSKDVRPHWVIVSTYETLDAERLRGNTRIPRGDRAQVNRILGDLDIVRNHYGGVGGYHVRESWGFWHRLPHDMRYPFNEIAIYELKK